MRVFRFFLNGVPAGEIVFTPGAPPIIAPAATRVLHRLPVPILPFLDPTGSVQSLLALASGSHIIPGLGVLRVEVL